ncbi:MAG: DUF4199 domain-containing protein [Alistipes sp.]
MKESKFVNEALSKGAILGLVMLASNIFEQAVLLYKGTLGWMGFLGIEMLVVACVYVALIYIFTKQYSHLVLAGQTDVKYFSYGSGLGYAVTVSVLCGVIVALGSYLFRHCIVGYETYTTNIVNTCRNLLSASNVPASMTGTYQQMFAQLQSQPEPSLWSSLLSGISNYFISGTVVGLIVAGFVKHTPNLFNDKTDDAE